MKKIALTSLLALVAAGGANAANTMDGNPLYMPAKGHFYSVTELSSDSRATNTASLGEEFGYGVTDRFAVSVATSLSQADWFDANSWDELELDLAYRLIGDGAWKLDVIGGYGVNQMWPDHRPFLDKDDTLYAWRLGVRGGYMTEDWTLGAHLNFIYVNDESFNWGDDNPYWANHIMNLGFDGHWTMSDMWSAVASADYFKIMDRYNDTTGWWELELGLNMNIDDTKYIGAYIEKDVAHTAAGRWELVDGFGFGLKFGIDF